MTSTDQPVTDQQLDSFLVGADPLAQQLQQLAQEPSDALTALIMARVAEQQKQTAAANPAINAAIPSVTALDGTTVIQPQAAANDTPHLKLVTPPIKRATWFRRYQTPLTLAASLLVAVVSTQQWQVRHQDNAAPAVASYSHTDEGTHLLAQADTPLSQPAGVVRLRAVDPAILGVPDPDKSATPANTDTSPTSHPPLKPEEWLAQITLLVKQNKLDLAKIQYQEFHKMYPDVVLPDATKSLFLEVHIIAH